MSPYGQPSGATATTKFSPTCAEKNSLFIETLHFAFNL